MVCAPPDQKPARVRPAIDLMFPAHAELRLQAADDILAVEPMEVPEVDELVAELNEIRGRRA